MQASVKVGGQTSDFSSRSFRFGQEQSGDVSRDTVNGQLNLDLPIANRDRAVLGAIGDLSLNVNAAANHLSDFGTLTTIGYGANWAPLEGVRVIASRPIRRMHRARSNWAIRQSPPPMSACSTMCVAPPRRSPP